MIPAAGDLLASREGAGEAHGGARDIGAVFGEAHHFGTRDEANELFGDFDLNGMREAEADPLFHLRADGLQHLRIRVPEDHGAKPHDVVEVARAIDIPSVGPSGAHEEIRRDTLHEASRALAEGLRASRDDALAPTEPRF